MRKLLLLTAYLIVAQTGLATRSFAIDRETLVKQLRHYEGIVQTLRCEYTEHFLETTPQQAELIKLVKGKDATNFVWSKEDSRDRSKKYILYRKGEKERGEAQSLDPELANQGATVYAFDGEVVRRVNYRSNDVAIGSIFTAKRASWSSKPKDDPIAYTYWYYGHPYSDIIASGIGFSSSVVERNEHRFHRVSVTMARDSTADVFDHSLVFLFDERLLLLERTLNLKNRVGKNFPNHKVVCTDYHSYATPSGEIAWFPSYLKQIGYNGRLSNGDPLEVRWKEFRVHKVEFNLDLPDKLFELEIPKNALINDGVTGMGWLPEGDRPSVLFPQEARIRRWWWTSAVLLAALMVIAAGILYKRRKLPKRFSRD